MAEILGPQKLGPLTAFVGEWEGNFGVDLSYRNKDDDTIQTSYFEKAWFRPIPIVENGQQTMEGLNYSMTAWRHGEEAMDPFHDEVGYLLWDKAHGQVIRCFAVPRGLAAMEPTDNVLVAYAARDGTTANDGAGRLTQFLLGPAPQDSPATPPSDPPARVNLAEALLAPSSSRRWPASMQCCSPPMISAATSPITECRPREL